MWPLQIAGVAVAAREVVRDEWRTWNLVYSFSGEPESGLLCVKVVRQMTLLTIIQLLLAL